MGSEQQADGDEANLAAEVAALSARVGALEQQLREIREGASAPIPEDGTLILPGKKIAATPAPETSAASEASKPERPVCKIRYNSLTFFARGCLPFLMKQSTA